MTTVDPAGPRKPRWWRFALLFGLLAVLVQWTAPGTLADGGGGPVAPGKEDTTQYIVTTTDTQSTVEADGELGGILGLMWILDIAF